MLSTLTSFCVSILLALSGFGYMSLAWGSLASIVVVVGASLWFRPQDFPRWPGIKGVGRVVRFGSFASGIYLFGQIGKGAPEIIIGRALDLVGVAMFSRGYGIVELFNRSVLSSVVPVCLPYFAKGNRDSGSVAGGYLNSIAYLTAIGWPFLSFIAIVAYAAIRVVYGDQWLAAVPLAQILCVAGGIELTHYLAKEALIAASDVRRSNALQIGIQCAHVVGLLAVIPFGLTGACFGLLVAAFVSATLSQWHLKRAIGLGLDDVARSCLPSLLITFLSVGPVALWVAFNPITECNYLRSAFFGGTLTALVWVVSLRLTGHPLWGEFVDLTRQLRTTLRTRAQR